MPRIVMIGAGSIAFARRLFIDIVSDPALQDGAYVFVDIDEDKLAAISHYGREVVKQHQLPTEVLSTTDRAEALDGADVVITAIAVGDETARQADVFIPQRYGVEQMVGDTIGPGGVFKGLRTVPAQLAICRDIEKYCPEAWLLNYTNPMAIATWAMNAATRVQLVGLCHSVQGTSRQLAGYMDVPYEELDYWVAGINHMAWFLTLERNGEDLYPRLREAMQDPEVYKKDIIRFEVLRHFDYFVTESTRHMGEYVPYFYKTKEHLPTWGLEAREYREGWSAERWQKHAERLQEELSGSEPVQLRSSEEYAVRIIRSLTTGEPCRINASVLNHGIIDNLPDGSCVEVPCMVERRAIRPCRVGALPPQLAALNRSNIALQQSAVEAILERDLRKAYYAVALDPLTSAILTLGEIRSMFDEMVEAQREWLADYLD